MTCTVQNAASTFGGARGQRANRSMASKVKTRTIPGGRFFSPCKRYNRNLLTRASVTAPLLSSPRCQSETAPNSSTRSKPIGPSPGPTACEPCARASETCACPTPARQDAEIVLPGAVSVRKAVDARAASGPSSRIPVCLGQIPGTCRVPIKATRSGTATQRDGSGSGWSHLFQFARSARPWLPQLGRAARWAAGRRIGAGASWKSCSRSSAGSPRQGRPKHRLTLTRPGTSVPGPCSSPPLARQQGTCSTGTDPSRGDLR